MDAYEKQLRKSKSFSSRLKVMYFFKEGIYGEWKRNCKIISALANEGKCTSGAILAYGSLNHFHNDRLAKLATLKSVKRTEFDVLMDSFKRNVETQEKFIASI